MNMPVLRIELDRIKYSISHALSDHNNEFNNMIKQSLDAHLNSDAFKAMVDQQVKYAANELIADAVKEAFKNDEFKKQVNAAVIKSMVGG